MNDLKDKNKKIKARRKRRRNMKKKIESIM
jgi:hypothetical protein